MPSNWVTTALAVLTMTAPASLAAQSARSVAVTFDDVPGVALSNCSNVVATNNRLLAMLKKHRVPATVFVVTGPGRCGANLLPGILKAWLADGHEVASHSHSHRDINSMPIAQYLADVDTADHRLRALLPRGTPLRYYRAPFLHTGNTTAKKDALAAKMRVLKYAPGVVTIDNQEWVFAEAYAKAKSTRDSVLLRRILPAYYAHLDESFAYYEELTHRLFGRAVPQVLLLHMNEINADHFEEVVALMRKRGYRFVSFEEAMRDRAYRSADDYVGAAGLSWLQRWALAANVQFAPEPREPKWLQ
jgi:peptidoglycan-N-acetylglucosamine deacetylase